MNIYGLIALLILIIILSNIFGLGPAIQQLAGRLADIPSFEGRTQNPELYTLAIRMIYLISIVTILRMLFSRSGDDE
jgi:Na+/H+ antiporter NhaC